MAKDPYLELQDRLSQKGIGSYFQNEDQLVISNENPAVPSTNSFWVTRKGHGWYLGTWLPAVYEGASDADLSTVCEAVFRSSDTALYTINPDLAKDLHLRRLTIQEVEQLGLA
jgi:hypothetical protein